MKVYGKCKCCGHEMQYTTNAYTRVEFAIQEGESKKINCEKCGADSEFSVDELYTKPSKIAQIGAGLIFLIGTPLMFFLINPVFTGTQSHYSIYFVGGFLLVPVVAYAIINKQDQTRVSDFNRRKLKGRTHHI
ncbi:hypothetical protein [Aquimarina litoralis]|uniref:hypothetical protein n=1 Tax=Aquimarina litoralis TaxID=584605 RepID=UPI001C57311F|nr:hypothetical protein [Aquimarina litoralis]MBW1294993.1 hypothetical protein [Aquimarina litoralis]